MIYGGMRYTGIIGAVAGVAALIMVALWGIAGERQVCAMGWIHNMLDMPDMGYLVRYMVEWYGMDIWDMPGMGCDIRWDGMGWIYGIYLVWYMICGGMVWDGYMGYTWYGI